MATTQKARAQLERIVELFSSKELPKRISKTYLESNGTPSDKWSLSNRLLMAFSGTHDARGYRQWQNAGRHVKKGAKAVYILGPNTAKVKDADSPEGSRTVVTGFRVIPVFRYEDTEGEKISYVKNEPKKVLP